MIKRIRMHLPVVALSLFLTMSGLPVSGVAHAEEINWDQLEDAAQKSFIELRRKAEKGKASAQHLMGLVHFGLIPGYGIRFSITESARWFALAAEQGYPDTLYLYGRLYAEGQWGNGEGLPAVTLWVLGTDKTDDFDTQLLIENLYEEGEWDKGQSPSKALELFERAAKKGQVKAQLYLGAMYYAGVGTPQDYGQAIKWFTQAAKGNDRVAQFALGYIYEKGESAPQNYKKAIKWFKRAGQQGIGEAQINLGYFHDNAIGTPKDQAEAFKWFKMAAENETTSDEVAIPAQFSIAKMYASGTGTSQDFTQATKWYGKLAKRGYIEAQFQLAEALHHRDNTAQDSEGALKYYLTAAKNKHAGAQYMLGAIFDMALIGLTHPSAHYSENAFEDRDKIAIEWYTKAAEQCHPKAGYQLGLHYSRGDGVPRDKVEAYKWFGISVSCGDNRLSQGSQNSVGERLTPEQVSEAQSRIAAWLEKHGK